VEVWNMKENTAVVAFVTMSLAGPLALADGVSVVAENVGFPEGPVWSDGRLLFAEYGTHRISALGDGAVETFWEQDGCGPAAIVEFGDGYAVTCYDSGELVLLSRNGEATRSIDADANGNPLIGPNDAAVAAGERLYFTASGPWESEPIVGRVLVLEDADGEAREVADDLHYANGIVVSADGSRLLVAESEAARVVSFAIHDDGALSDRRLHLRLTALGEPHDAYPDGLKIGPDGHLYIGLYSAGRVLVADGDGNLVRTIEVPSAAAPNLAFDADGSTLYVMAVDDQENPPYYGKVYRVDNP
jgi:gluconolactonase